jgi:hypothetical protein
MDPRGALGAQLVRGAMPLGGILAEVVEPELIGPGLIEEALEVAAEGFQLVELLLHEAVHRFHVAVVSGAVGRVEAVLAAAVFLLDQAGEGRGRAAVPSAAELAAVVGLHGKLLELDPAGGQVGQQAIAEQQGVGGVVDGGEGQPDAAFGYDAGGELVAGQPEGDPLAVAWQIREVFDVYLEQAEGRPAEFLSGQASGWGTWLFAALAASGLLEDAGDGARRAGRVRRIWGPGCS